MSIPLFLVLSVFCLPGFCLPVFCLPVCSLSVLAYWHPAFLRSPIYRKQRVVSLFLHQPGFNVILFRAVMEGSGQSVFDHLFFLQ